MKQGRLEREFECSFACAEGRGFIQTLPRWLMNFLRPAGGSKGGGRLLTNVPD